LIFRELNCCTERELLRSVYRVASLWHSSSGTCVISRHYLQVSVRPLPNADFLSSDWFMRLWEGQPFSFKKILVMWL